MFFTADIGNTRTKLALFDEHEMVSFFTCDDETPSDEIVQKIASWQPKAGIISSVRQELPEWISHLKQTCPVFTLSHRLRLNFDITYATPDTLGTDRLANAAGAVKKYAGLNVLVIDCGTCITYTLINENALVGGSIAPGIKMRYQALHHFTGKLPLVSDQHDMPDIPGTDTFSSITTGVQHGIIAETDGMIQSYCSKFGQLNVILTGGNMAYFEKHLKSPIFAVPYLTLEGLNEILRINFI